MDDGVEGDDGAEGSGPEVQFCHVRLQEGRFGNELAGEVQLLLGEAYAGRVEAPLGEPERRWDARPTAEVEDRGAGLEVPG